MTTDTTFPSVHAHGTIRQPFRATCRKCGETIYFDIDPSGTPGFNGDWGNGDGDWGCSVDNGDDSEDGNGHVPTNIVYDLHLFPRPE